MVLKGLKLAFFWAKISCFLADYFLNGIGRKEEHPSPRPPLLLPKVREVLAKEMHSFASCLLPALLRIVNFLPKISKYVIFALVSYWFQKFCLFPKDFEFGPKIGISDQILAFLAHSVPCQT